MEKWVGKVAVVTGAASGIGAETSRQLVNRGMVVVGFDKREDGLKVKFKYQIIDKFSKSFNGFEKCMTNPYVFTLKYGFRF